MNKKNRLKIVNKNSDGSRSLLLLISIAICFSIFESCHKEETKNFELYYLDSLAVSSLTNAPIDCIWFDYHNITSNGKYIYLKNPLELSADSLRTNIYIKVGKNTKVVSLEIKCWKDNYYTLKEVNITNKLFHRIERYYYNHYTDSVKNFKHFYNPILLTRKGVTYFVDNGVLKKIDKNGNSTEFANIGINDPMYNQMICDGNFGFIRSGHNILMSDDSLKSWSNIYEGPRAIKESMYWNTDDSTLIFSQYTPGSVRNRHYILKYNYNTANTDTIFTFYTEKEFLENGLSPCARHIHVLTVDPYTGWLFVGTGDSDIESAIHISKDQGKTFDKLGSGAQVWRTLSFIFTPDYVFWNTDSHMPQYLSRISRNKLENLPADSADVIRFPILNSALWNTIPYGDITLMTSNVEGALYDNNRRIYGIIIDKSGIPQVYNLWQEEGNRWSSQLFPIGVTNNGIFQFYDNQNLMYRYFILLDKNGKRL